MRFRALLSVALAAVLLSGCAHKRRTRAIPAPPVGSEESGIASWYGHPYHGRAAANGEIYDMEKMTAAHRVLPFGTNVLVQNLDNGLDVQVRINDRGPFVKGRIIDLSRAAARQIKMLGPGTAKVRLKVLGTPPLDDGSYFAVQIGAFRDRANAEKRRHEMEARYGAAHLMRREGKTPVWKVLVGREDTVEGANELADKLRSELGAAFVLRVDRAMTNQFD